MHNKSRSAAVRAAALLLAILFICPFSAFAAEPRASYYLDTYLGYIYPAGNGLIQIYFQVVGTDDMDEIGVLTIKLYESTDNVSFSLVKTFTHDSTEGMLAYGKFFFENHVDYQGIAGRYYMAELTIWAGRDGTGDTRTLWLGPTQAT